MAEIRLNEAFAFAKDSGKKVMKKSLAAELWPGSRPKTAHANISNLCNGKTKKIDIGAVPVICKALGVSADYLFGIDEAPTKAIALKELRERIDAAASRMKAAVEQVAEVAIEIKETI